MTLMMMSKTWVARCMLEEQELASRLISLDMGCRMHPGRREVGGSSFMVTDLRVNRTGAYGQGRP